MTEDLPWIKLRKGAWRAYHKGQHWRIEYDLVSGRYVVSRGGVRVDSSGSYRGAVARARAAASEEK